MVLIVSLAAVWNRLRRLKHHRKPGHGISLLVPFLASGPERERNWNWLREYWSHALPGAEIIVAPNYDRPFCKTKAVNLAFRRSSGDVVVILDADAYLPAKSILECAEMIRSDRRLSFVPYRRMYRMTESATTIIVHSDPDHPVLPSDPPPAGLWTDEGGSSAGHWFAALVQILPREAFEAVGGMDERFRGWGGEDISFMRAVDTLHGLHKTFDGPAFHLWHPTVKAVSPNNEKQWAGQPRNVMNSALTNRYARAFLDRVMMQKLVAEHQVARVLGKYL